jgi:hypothetical protein
VAQRVERREHRLVVLRRRRVGDRADHPRERADREPLERRDDDVRVEVVAVRRVDVVAQPQARVGDLDGRRAQPGRQPLGDPGGAAGRDALVEPERGGRVAALAPIQPAGGDRVVVVAGREDDLPGRAQRVADRPHDRLGDGQRVARRAVAQLQRVAEQHEPVDAVEALEQHRERLRSRQHVGARARAEMQVGDDERAQASTSSSPRGPRGCAWAA